MTRLVEVRTRIASMGELLDIVGAMHSLAAMRVQEAQRGLTGVRRYAAALASAIDATLQLSRERPANGRRLPGSRALIVCMAEHGFVGGFNERLLDAAQAWLQPRDELFILGSRGAALAQERGGRAQLWSGPMATRLESVPETVRRLATELYAAIARGSITQADVLFAAYRLGNPAAIQYHRLYPLELAASSSSPARLPPLHNLPPDVLLEKLIGQYVYALLTEAAVESLASENAARFTAMQAANDSVSKKLEQLGAEEREARQSEITMELLDLVTGAQALQNSG